MSASTSTSEPLLRTLAPALRQMEQNLRLWLDAVHYYPLSTLARAALEGLATDLHRQAEALRVEQPLLVIILMGGTGVGKSTLLNALAGGNIAEASFTRPTTRAPVVYYHESVKVERLDPVLRQCRLVAHHRQELEQKIIVDTPDLDSNDILNREKLYQLLPLADIVLYVGSQEKYHDRLGWDLFRQQHKRHAFAFILNKWDRCIRSGGLRPDADLLRDLQHEGFPSPLLFRTCAQHWVDRAAGNGSHELPEQEEFLELVRWLEIGLSRREIEAVKARGVGQLLQQLHQALTAACPPDLGEASSQTAATWQHILAEEATAASNVLLHTLEPYQSEIEQHFTVEGRRRFRGLMAGYLHLFTRARYAGTSLWERIPFWPRSKDAPTKPASWDMAAFSRSCSDIAANRYLDARGKALANRLLVEANQQGFPLQLLSEPLEKVVQLDWRNKYAQTLLEVVREVEQQWSRPTGMRRWVQTGLIWLGDWLPPVSLLAACIRVLWLYFMTDHPVQLVDFLLPLVVLMTVLIILHLLIALLLPLRWPAIRGAFHKHLEHQLRHQLENFYGPVPGQVSALLAGERRRIEVLLDEVHEIARWLEQREQEASIAPLYEDQKSEHSRDVYSPGTETTHLNPKR